MRKAPRTEGYESPDLKTHPVLGVRDAEDQKGKVMKFQNVGIKKRSQTHPEEDEEQFIKNATGIRMTLKFTIVRVEDRGQ